jgi:hypothetical protein
MVKEQTLTPKDDPAMEEPMEVEEDSQPKDKKDLVLTVKKGSVTMPAKQTTEEEEEEEDENMEEEEEEEGGDNSSPGDSGGGNGGGGGGKSACTSDPNFAVICSFIEKFGVSSGIPCPSIGELQVRYLLCETVLLFLPFIRYRYLLAGLNTITPLIYQNLLSCALLQYFRL